MEFIISAISLTLISNVKNIEFAAPALLLYSSSLTPTTSSIFVIIALNFQLLSDKYLLFPDIILDVSTRVPNHLNYHFLLSQYYLA